MRLSFFSFKATGILLIGSIFWMCTSQNKTSNITSQSDLVDTNFVELDTVIEEIYFEENFVRYNDFIYVDNIKTVQLYKVGSPLYYPIIHLNGNEKLKLSFDDLSNDRKTYTYSIIHCNANWEQSELGSDEYLTGFDENYIEDFKFSMGTYTSYIHYNVKFPNENIDFKISGNYIIKVYEDADASTPILTKRFMIVETKVRTSINIKEATNVSERYYRQEVDFMIDHAGYEILDPYQRLNVVIMQNHRWDNAITGLVPKFIKGTELDYNYNEENVFDGINEFRAIDMKNLRNQLFNIKKVEYNSSEKLDHVYLMNDESRSYKKYYTESDLNGNFLVKRDGSLSSSETEADYVKVHFSLPYSPPIRNGNLYLFGKFSDWQFKEELKLEYDTINNKYTQEVLLKQGYYNYAYCFVKDGSKNTGSIAVVEGTHYETENDYSILVYHRKPSENYDRLIGYTTANTIRR